MSQTFTPKLSILPPAQIALLPQLRPAVEMGLVLYRGTAIALRLGHRQSVDFDFFTEAELDKEKIWRFLDFMSDVVVIQESPDGLTLLVGGDTDKEVKLSFFGTIDSGRAGVPELTRDGHVLVASLVDLLASKLKVILQRIALKDYHDIAAIIQSGMKLEEGLGVAKALYGNKFQPSECLKALVYFEGGDLAELDDVNRKTLIEAVSCVGRLPDMQKASKCLSVD
jgi:hypothetical protein